jgi:drug/metabolite transporter (DMT)-like permease
MHKSSALGIALKLGATLAFSLMYVVIRLAGTVPTGEVVFFRAFFALVPLFALSAFTAGPIAVIRTKRPLMHLIRSVTGVSSMFFNFTALKMLPLAELTGFSFVAPIFATVLAALLLREKVGPFRGAAVVVGFAGVLVMVEPSGGLGSIVSAGSSPGSGLALIGALLSAFVVVFIRQMSSTERSETIVFYFMLFTALAGAVTMIWWHVALSPMMTLWLVLSGILGGVGQICMTYSYRYAEPSLLAPFDYVAMVWAALFGFVFFLEVPDRLVIVGAAVVVGSGLFIAWRERRHHQAIPEPVTP